MVLISSRIPNLLLGAFCCAETHGHGVVCADFGIWYMEHVYPQEWYKLGKAWCENEWT